MISAGYFDPKFDTEKHDEDHVSQTFQTNPDSCTRLGELDAFSLG